MVPCACSTRRGVALLDRSDLKLLGVVYGTVLVGSSGKRGICSTRHGAGVMVRLWESKVEESNVGAAVVAGYKSFGPIY